MKDSLWRSLHGSIRLPRFICLALLLSLLGLSSCSNSAVPVNGVVIPVVGPALQNQWVAAWGASDENALPSASNPGGQDQSFRFVVLPTIYGTQERVHLTNRLGLTPVVIGAARLSVANQAGPSIDPTRDVPLTFGGSTSITIPPGEELLSDPVNVPYNSGEKLAVSLYLKGSFGPLMQHVSPVLTNFVAKSGSGDTTTDISGHAFTADTSEWLVLNGIDVYGQYQGTVAVFGSSSVDGFNSNRGDSNTYPIANVPIPSQDDKTPADWLARQLIAAGYRMGVLNAGAIGDPAGDDGGTLGGGAIAGVNRMQHDVLEKAGIKAVVIYFGGVDLRGDCKSAASVEASLEDMTQQAQRAGVRVILATVPPSEYCTHSEASLLPSSSNPYGGDINPGPENPGSTQRRSLNDWIRSSGASLPGVVAIADFDKAIADPAHPDFMLPNLNSGDNFHPNGQGYGVQSAAIPLSSILGQ